MRVGIGFDAHAFAEGRLLVLGGVTIPSKVGLEGHSDSDVLSHAIADAVLGAAALGDLGQHFPSSDARWADADSLEILARVAVMVGAVGLRVGSVDSTVIIAAPPLAPHRDLMRMQIAQTLGVDVERISVKASTTDGLGFVGRGEGAAAMAVAVLEPLPT